MPHHPVHAKGYPSHGDAKDTIPVPSMDERAKPEGKGEGTTKFVDFKFEGDKSEWCGYARERLGRFVGLINKDGTTKTECGIHVEGAEKTFDRDLWDTSKTVKTLESTAAVDALVAKGEDAVVVVYAPWCQFCQAMEEEVEKLAADGVTVYKFRGDEEREYVGASMNTASFPTVNKLVGGTFVKYDSEDRTVSALKAFAK